jgi:putative oxidoreductase
METGLLIIRVVVGLTLVAHGAQKLFGAFGGYGIAGTGGFFESIGMRPGKLFATLAGLGETGGGLGLALGLFTPFAAAAIIATMIVAILKVHLQKGFFAQNGGYEYPLVLGAVAAGLAFTGPGNFSLDAIAGLPFAGVKWGLIALGLGVLGALPPLVVRPAPSSRPATT